MRDLIITTKMAFPILSLVNKLELRKPLINMVKNQIQFQLQKDLIYKELNTRANPDENLTEEYTEHLLTQSPDLCEKLNAIENDIRLDSLNFILDIVEKVPYAESEFYKTISLVTGEKVKEIESKDISEVVDIVTSIVMSKSFMGLLNVMNQ